MLAQVLAQVMGVRLSLGLILGRALVLALALHRLALGRAQRGALQWARAQAQPGGHAHTSARVQCVAEILMSDAGVVPFTMSQHP